MRRQYQAGDQQHLSAADVLDEWLAASNRSPFDTTDLSIYCSPEKPQLDFGYSPVMLTL